MDQKSPEYGHFSRSVFQITGVFLSISPPILEGVFKAMSKIYDGAFCKNSQQLFLQTEQ